MSDLLPFDNWHDAACETLEAPDDHGGIGDLEQQILYRLRNADHDADVIRCMELYRLLDRKTQCNLSCRSQVLELGVDYYEQGRFPAAEKVFSVLAQQGDRTARNNLAYMIRRGETSPDNRAATTALRLLQPGLRERHAYAMVNMALLLVERLGAEKDWLLGDKLIAMLKDCTEPLPVYWWEKLGRKGETEGYLVHLWFLRHGLIPKSRLGTYDQLLEKVRKTYPDIPAWMGEIL